ncbi:MAG: glycosyltransferase 2 family protein [Pseudonocardiales bacterium]|nr:glycosyltransferase 2 family protein [Pseudonocardiales bacterium]
MTARAAKRLALAWLPFAATLIGIRSRRLTRWELAVSRHVNGLPEGLHRPVWLVMQAGTLGAPMLAGGAAMAAGQPALARRLAGSGLSAYLLAKGVKRIVRRGRPADLTAGIRIRGRPASGDGYVSGHAAVSMALAAEAALMLDARARPLPYTAASVVAVARLYVGAHLPMDALGGAALGWAISRTASELRRRTAPRLAQPDSPVATPHLSTH